MNLQAIIVSNGIAIVLLIMLLLCMRVNIKFNRPSERLFVVIVWATIVMAFFEAVSFVVDRQTFNGAIIIAKLSNCIVFSLNIIFAYMWVDYIRHKLCESTHEKYEMEPMIMLPMIAVLMMSIMTLFMPILYKIDSANVYSRTKLTSFSFLTGLGYLVYAEILIYRDKNRENQYLFLPSVIFLMPIFIGSGIQMYVYGISLNWVAVAISLTTIYINLQSGDSSVDSLSGLYSRRYLDEFLTDDMDIPAGKVLIGIMIDIDRFKNINDSYGHLAGDNAISRFGRILRAATEKNDIVGRFGGDEFIVLAFAKKEEAHQDTEDIVTKIQQGIDKLNAETFAKYQMSFSYGVGSIESLETDTIKDFLDRIDMSMYKRKKERSNELPERRS